MLIHIEPLRERFRANPSETRAIKYAGASIIEFHYGSIDDTTCAAILREVAEWLDAPSGDQP